LVQGTPASTIFKGLPVYELGNLFGFDAATLDNHEFDYGWERTREFIAHANYPIVSETLPETAAASLRRFLKSRCGT
jgi:2',3'-cyclic-nucleotide 2'-phosphodiesterase (5'-nucleotidase family)